MIKFFRRVRQQLLSENKVSKYMLYAIGEIILVVIGILIALWINSTFQDYKDQQQALVFLKDFKRDLVSDTLVLHKRINANKKRVRSIDSIDYLLSNKTELTSNENSNFLEYNTDIMRESYFVPEKVTIRQLESSNNGNLIPSKALKDKLFEYYTFHDRNEKNMEASVQLYQHDLFTRNFTKIYMMSGGLKRIHGNNPALDSGTLEKIRNNEEYISSLFFKKSITENQNISYRDLITKAEVLIIMIDATLKP